VRGPVLFAHVATPAAVVLLFSVLGFGSLYATIALAAEWWALLLVTGFRPERLLSTGGLGRLAAWATLAGAATLVTTRVVFQIRENRPRTRTRVGPRRSNVCSIRCSEPQTRRRLTMPCARCGDIIPDAVARCPAIRASP